MMYFCVGGIFIIAPAENMFLKAKNFYMDTKDFENGKLITLSKPFDTRAKILSFIYFIFFFAAATYFLKNFLLNYYEKNIGNIIAIIASIIFYICSYRFCNKAVLSEKLFVDKNHIKLIKQGFLNNKGQMYDVNKISKFNYLPKPKMPEHPLNNKTFDALGVQTEQELINEMYGDNKISFDYTNEKIEFGNDIYSWDFEELLALINKITGKNFIANETL